MRYIKPFNENTENLKDELLDLCEGSLAYLMDDDYRVMITRRDSLPIDSEYHKRGYIIHFYKWVGGKTDFFEFSEVEDHFIPFIQRLSKEYTIIECMVDYFVVGKSSTKLSVDQVINGGIEPNKLITRILIIVEEE